MAAREIDTVGGLHKPSPLCLWPEHEIQSELRARRVGVAG